MHAVPKSDASFGHPCARSGRHRVIRICTAADESGATFRLAVRYLRATEAEWGWQVNSVDATCSRRELAKVAAVAIHSERRPRVVIDSGRLVLSASVGLHTNLPPNLRRRFTPTLVSELRLGESVVHTEVTVILFTSAS